MLLEQNRGLGWLPDPDKAVGEKPDWDADIWYGEEPVPERGDNRDQTLILAQSGAPSCVAHAGVLLLRAEHIRQGHEYPPLGSRMWAWLFSRLRHGAMNDWSGTYYRTMWEALNRYGLPQEKWWPYVFDELDGVPRWRAAPSSKARQMAHDQKQTIVYRRIRETGYERVDAIKRLIGNKHKCVDWGTMVSRRFVRGDYRDDESADPPGPNDEILGGHAMLLDYFEGDDFEGPQTYGADYWLRGRYRVTADYLASPLSRDFWVVEQFPIYSEEEIQP